MYLENKFSFVKILKNYLTYVCSLRGFGFRKYYVIYLINRKKIYLSTYLGEHYDVLEPVYLSINLGEHDDVLEPVHLRGPLPAVDPGPGLHA